MWFTESGTAEFVWRGHRYTSLAQFQQATGQSAHGLFADPHFQDAGNADFHLSQNSPAIDRGDPAYQATAGETDMDGEARIANGRVDIGADEYGSVVKIGVWGEKHLSRAFQLLPAYPNPFNGSINIPVRQGRSAETVRVWIMDLLGRRVAQLQPVVESGGLLQYRWQGMDATGNPVASGMYFIVAQSGLNRAVERILLKR